MAIEEEIADIVKRLDEHTGELVTAGSKRIKRDMYKRQYAKTVAELWEKSKLVGRIAAEKMCNLSEEDMDTYADIVNFWSGVLNNVYEAAAGAERLPDWLSKVGSDESQKKKYAELVKSANRMDVSSKLAEDMPPLTEQERTDYAGIMKRLGDMPRYSFVKSEAMPAAERVFGLVKGGKLKEAEAYVASLGGQQAEIEQANV